MEPEYEATQLLKHELSKRGLYVMKVRANSDSSCVCWKIDDSYFYFTERFWGTAELVISSLDVEQAIELTEMFIANSDDKGKE